MDTLNGTVPAEFPLTVSDRDNDGLLAAPDSGDVASDERWDCYSELLIQLAVAIPLQELSLHRLSTIKPGSMLTSLWSAADDVPLYAGSTFLADVCFEPVGSKLGVRINGFQQRSLPVSVRDPKVEEAEEAPGPLGSIRHLRLSTSLCFGTTQMQVNEVLKLSTGDIVTLDRPVNAPASVVLKGRTVASGSLVLVAGCYAVQVSHLAKMSRDLERCK